MDEYVINRMRMLLNGFKTFPNLKLLIADTSGLSALKAGFDAPNTLTSHSLNFILTPKDPTTAQALYEKRVDRIVNLLSGDSRPWKGITPIRQVYAKPQVASKYEAKSRRREGIVYIICNLNTSHELSVIAKKFNHHPDFRNLNQYGFCRHAECLKARVFTSWNRVNGPQS